ncbi:MAG: GNAT family N-acetyltransferase [Muribaculaceae bacterium]|nr:GNAT family N-acetyltransferase [Muribaculaceae bacterium]
MIDLKEVKDIEILMAWREEVIRNVFGEEAGSQLLEVNRQYYLRHIVDGAHIALVAAYQGTDCGCGGICFSEELPSPDNPSGKCAYLMNIYVREEFRKHGIAHKIVTRLIDEAKKHECGKIYLETTAEGRSVYTSLGFREMTDMMKYYGTENAD